MKLSDITEGSFYYPATSLDGVERKFKTKEQADAWKVSYFKEPRAPREPVIREPEPSRMERLQLLWDRFETAVGNTFPDGDPVSSIYRWMEMNDFDTDDLDIAARKIAKAKSYADYLAKLWDEYAKDAAYDAMMGAHGETYDGAWFQQRNPWK